MSVASKISKMQGLAWTLKIEAEKFDRGNNAAGTRVRKGMMEIKRLAQEVREEVTAVKAAK